MLDWQKQTNTKEQQQQIEHRIVSLLEAVSRDNPNQEDQASIGMAQAMWLNL